ncbi:protein LONGIFOLIA 1-like [Rutidosis leptorrhynchoides]|uniref:protein LONGIFOLIA 1-like n=1 Tax=Rutidosis leptorrhynchoides TaxID=125765 RepID=UPI003A9A255B
MATKVVYSLREDKQGLNKQLGCMNGIFQLFDRRYLLGLHRHGRNQNRLTQGQDGNGEKEFKHSTETKPKHTKKVLAEKNRASAESSRNSSSSSGSSTTFSSLDCSKRAQTERQLSREPGTLNTRSKKPDCRLQPLELKNVVKDSMTRGIRVKKDEQVGPVIKHIDSPRPFVHQKPLQCDSKDRKTEKIQKPSMGVKEIKETSRSSCDERKSQYSLKSTFKVNELPRLSLDSKQNSDGNFTSESKREPGSNKRPSSGVVARLMGLENLTDSVPEVANLKIKQAFNDQLVSSPRWSRQSEECKHNHVSVSPRVHLNNTKSGALAPASVYCEMEKRLSVLEFKTSGNDLRALKQILEAMQTNKMGLDSKDQKTEQPGSPVINRTSSPKSRTVKPRKVDTVSMMVTGVHSINNATRKQVKRTVPRNKKVTERTSRSLLNSPGDVIGVRPVSSPRPQSSKKDDENRCFLAPASDSNKSRKQSNVQPVVSYLKTRHPKIKLPNQLQNNKQSCRYSNDQLKDDHKINFAERLMEDRPNVELAKLTVEQQSPVSVLDAFYTEEALSPVKKKPSLFKDCEILHDVESEWNHMRNDVLLNGTDTNQYSDFNHVKLENRNNLIHQIDLLSPVDETVASSCKSRNDDYRYVSEILSASGFPTDPDFAIRLVQLHPGNNLIEPELFDILEKTKAECIKNKSRSKSNNTIRRKLIFDCVNDILLHKLVVSSGKLVKGEKLMQELWLEIDNLESTSRRCVYDEDDEVKNLVSADVKKSSDDWDKCCYEVPSVVLDIERQIFKDLINEVVNAEVATLQYRPPRHCRRLFCVEQ